MERMFELLLLDIMKHKASDIHFTFKQGKLNVSFRNAHGMLHSKQIYDSQLFHYLKYISHLDLGNVLGAQSGNFTYLYRSKKLYFRFACIQTQQLQSGVLRVLNNHDTIQLNMLSRSKEQNAIFKQWCQVRGGLTIVSGPTGSGKTTTLHALLEEIACSSKLKVITLEDPIEIQSDNYLQFQINEKTNFTYEEGIKQLLRHDPDVIMIGEVRDEQSAKTLVRCALSGHMVFTTLHAKSCREAITRLLNFGVIKEDLEEVLTALTNQRIFPTKNGKGKVCIYEILQGEELKYYFEFHKHKEQYKDIFRQIKHAHDEGYISKKACQHDIEIKKDTTDPTR